MTTLVAPGAAPNAFVGSIGVARATITPPPGINARNWGASPFDVAEGVHRPLTATVLAIAPPDATGPVVLAAADLGWWKSREDEWLVRGGLIDALRLDSARVLLSLSHTHAGPNLYRMDHDKRGGKLIAPYLATLRDQLIATTRSALAACRPARLSWRTGRCDLAQNRDLREPGGERFVVGWNPEQPADDTLLIGRVEDLATGRVAATLVNYACHPTTLAFMNRWLSPDFPGAMRELVERETGAPCLFLQGASGDLAPAAQHDAEPAVADRLGRRLGYAVLSVVEGWPDGMRTLVDVVESGAPVATTRPAEPVDARILQAEQFEVELPLKPLQSLEDLSAALARSQSRSERERQWRRLAVRRIVGDAATYRVPVWCWRLGDALLVAQPNEAYSFFQVELRRRFPAHPLVVLNVTNGYAGYLPPQDQYSRDQYSVTQTPFAAGSLERLIEATSDRLSHRLAKG